MLKRDRGEPAVCKNVRSFSDANVAETRPIRGQVIGGRLEDDHVTLDYSGREKYRCFDYMLKYDYKEVNNIRPISLDNVSGTKKCWKRCKKYNGQFCEHNLLTFECKVFTAEKIEALDVKVMFSFNHVVGKVDDCMRKESSTIIGNSASPITGPIKNFIIGVVIIIIIAAIDAGY